jgi:hypothetical protein
MSEIDGDLAPGVAEVLARLYVLKQNKNPQKYAATLSISSMARRSAAVPQRRCGTSSVNGQVEMILKQAVIKRKGIAKKASGTNSEEGDAR